MESSLPTLFGMQKPMESSVALALRHTESLQTYFLPRLFCSSHLRFCVHSPMESDKVVVRQPVESQM